MYFLETIQESGFHTFSLADSTYPSWEKSFAIYARTLAQYSMVEI